MRKMTHVFFQDASILVSVGVFLTHQFETVGVFAHFLSVIMQKCPLSGALNLTEFSLSESQFPEEFSNLTEFLDNFVRDFMKRKYKSHFVSSRSLLKLN